ncbi:MAG: hypothetical protein ACUVQ8_05080 [Nitrososphaeria archaeon]
MPIDESSGRKPKAILLYSGGLDSTIALYFLVSMGVNVVALTFDLPFCSTGPNSRVSQSITENVRRLGVKVITAAADEEYLKILRHPRYGYGRSVNPCVDCRIHMLKHAKKVMEEEGADFIATGEVVGQRPFSQKVRRLIEIDKEAGVEGLVVRPLSAKLLPETIPVKRGLVRREDMFDIQGRSRSAQMKLAEKYGVEVYPTPAGGCLLTEPAFGRRFRDLKVHCQDFSLKEVVLLRFGRHFRFDAKSKVIVCRDQTENETILKYVSQDDILFQVLDYSGPLCVYFGELAEDKMTKAASYAVSYSKAPRDSASTVRFWNLSETYQKIVQAHTLSIEEIHRDLI